MDLLCAFELNLSCAWPQLQALVLVSRSINYHISLLFLHHTNGSSIAHSAADRTNKRWFEWSFFLFVVSTAGISYQCTGDWSMFKRVLSICHVL